MSAPFDGLAVIVVNYGSAGLLAQNLVQVANDAPGATIVVVDNYTTVDEAHRVRELCRSQRWEFVPSPVNLGFGGGMNLGAEHALRGGATTLLLLNPDARIDTDSMSRLYATVSDDPRTLAAPVIHTTTGRVWFAGTDLHLDRGYMLASRKRAADSAQVFSWLTGACLMISSSLWVTVGGFDEKYFLYWEDVDICWRIVDAGGRLVVLTEASAIHDEGGTQESSTTRSHSEIYYYYNIKNRLVFAADHLDRRTQLRWALAAIPEGYKILLRGGKRHLLMSLAPWRALVRGTAGGLRVLIPCRLR